MTTSSFLRWLFRSQVSLFHYSAVDLVGFNFAAEILLLGTGSRLVPPPQAIRQHLNNIGVQIDVMDTVRYILPLVFEHNLYQPVRSA